jgi:hypothetical protein
MPLTPKGEEIKKNMEKEYGPKKGEEVFYASANKGTITGVHHDSKDATEPQPSSGPMATKGPVGTEEGLPKATKPFAGDAVGRGMSLDEIKSNAKRIGRY